MQPELIAVINDAPTTCQSISNLLESDGYRVASYASATEFLGRPAVDDAACVLADISASGGAGIEMIDRLRSSGGLPVVVMSDIGNVSIAVEAMKRGAADFIQKPYDDLALLSSLREAIVGGNARQDLPFRDPLGDDARRRLADLTTRENEIMDRMIRGKINKVIAFEMNISIRTVETHRYNLMRKVKVKNIAELVGLKFVAERASRYGSLCGEGAAKPEASECADGMEAPSFLQRQRA